MKPDYYKSKTGKDVIDIIEEYHGKEAAIAFCLGNVHKYVVRFGKKQAVTSYEDLDKAATYLQRAKSLSIVVKGYEVDTSHIQPTVKIIGEKKKDEGPACDVWDRLTSKEKEPKPEGKE